METSVRNLMFDLTSGREIYDEKQGRVISNEEANEVLRKACFELLGLNAQSTEKQIKRALESDRAIEFFEVMEEILDRQIEYGWRDNEFFQNYVETRNQKDGDRTDFWTDDEIILNVAKVSGDHHDLKLMQDRVRVA